ncbi:cilia- and flagella-associated protein 100 [Physcomitrium patens]|uniref:cilia- and flagella-associated protein 100 n=1 Tax=Physcomitrium patens TaxID=3218 RepID=UPI003CCE4A9C
MPFVMPSDEKVYHIRALSKKKEREDAQRDMFRSVQDKTTFASRSAAFVGSERLKNELKAMDQEMEQLLLSLKQQPPMLQTCYYHRDKENLQEFVAKKREIFFVQMSLDTKRSEIRKLEERIFQREEALRKSEEMLEEDSIEFDAFLKKNDEKMQEALKKAEKNTKLKQDKVMEIKKLNTEMGIVRAEVSKYEEQLEDCKKYKEFLVRLTPFEWFEEQAILKSEREEQRRNLASQGVTTPTEPEEEEEVTYFQHPHQLLEIYNDIEVSNLALLQQCQEIEGMLESFKTKMRDARATNDTDINSLRSQLAALQAQVRLEDEKQATLKRNASLNVEGTEHEITFEMLCTKVLSTYLRCGMDPDPSLGTLQMLSMIEQRMEDGLQMLKGIPQEFMKATEKAREKERREKAREDNMTALAAALEERRRKALARSKAPIPKRIGKPPMPRSFLPPKKKKEGVDKSGESDDAEFAEFLGRDY